ncbi:MAG: TonB-dependent receptor [Acidobacteria bacterium]|nr:TonB-dependent receptor [Acidobacteriota bacterium]
MRNSFWAYVLLLSYTLPASLWAQSSAGYISGTTRDRTGAVMKGVVLQARQEESDTVYTSVTDEQGRYEFLRLPPGQYEITPSYHGFQPSERKRLSLNAGQAVSLDLVLEVRGIEQTITVTGEVAPLDLSSPHLNYTVNEISFTSLPINGRTLDRLALLAPGMIPVRAKDDRPVNGFTQKIAGNGSRGSAFLLDGTDIGHGIFQGGTPGGVSGLLLGMDSVQEFEVLTDAYPAYLGNTGGAVINVITRRGTANFHGSLFEYYRNSDLDARNFFDDELPPFTRHQFGGSVGGPLPGTGNTFLVGYEGLRERLGLTLFNTVPNLAARGGVLPGKIFPVKAEMRPILDRYPLPNGPDFGDGTAQYGYQQVQPTDDHHINARTDFNLRRDDSLFLRYTFYDSAKLTPLGLSIQGFDSDLAARNQYVTLEESHIFSPRLLNTFQLAYNRSHYRGLTLTRPDLAAVAPLIDGRSSFGRVNIRGLSSFGTDTGDLVFSTNQYELSNSVRYAFGRHDFRGGFNWKHYRSNGSYDAFFDGLLIYENLESFLTNQPQRFVGAEPGSDAHKNYRQNLFALYLHDQYRLGADLTLTYGLRYQWFTVPTEEGGRLSNLRRLTDPAPVIGNPLFINPSRVDLAPRVGVAWNIGGRNHTVIRSGFGIFHEPIQENIFGYNARLQPPFVTIRTIIRPPYPRPFSSRVQGRPRLDPLEFQPETPYVMRYHLTLEQMLGPDLVLRIGYSGSRGVHLPRVGDLNSAAPISVDPDGRPYYGSVAGPRRNPAFDLVRYTSTDANSVYNSLQIGFARRWKDGLQLGLNYTFGRSIDDASAYRREFSTGIGDVPPDYYYRTVERALSSFHIAHQAVFHYTWDLPLHVSRGPLAAFLLNHWQTAGIVTLSSGYPFTLNVSFDIANNLVREGHRPNLVSGASNNPVLGGPNRYFDVSAFQLQRPGYLGTLGRNTLIAPGYASVDFVITKDIRLTEAQRLQFRFEIFNLFNRPNFAAPQNSATGGVIVFNSLDGIPVGNASTIFSTVGSSRQLQLGLRWGF